LLDAEPDGEPSAAVHERVCEARERARARQGCANSLLERRALYRVCALSAADRREVERAFARLRLSVRGCLRVLRVARTIADLSLSSRVEGPHIAEALGYRQMETR
jgi:magnesium chelatase family protein